MPLRRLGPTAVALLCATLLLSGCSVAALRDAATGSAATPTPEIVTIGDSIMAGYGLGDGEDWPSILAEEDGLNVHNIACSGAGFTNPGSCGTDYAGLVAQAAKLHPTMVIIQSSSNDIGATKDEIESATDSTVATLHSLIPHARIVGISTIWNDTSDLPAEIAWSSDALRSALRGLGGRYVDVGQPLQGHPEWMQSDDVHPTLAGQEAILEQVRTVMLARGIRV